jgi:hypothetical protein
MPVSEIIEKVPFTLFSTARAVRGKLQRAMLDERVAYLTISSDIHL